jgi:hypothetical protein
MQGVSIRTLCVPPAIALSPANAVGLNASNPIRIGNTLRMGYTCDDGVPSNATCTPDDYAFTYDSVTHLPFRTGNYQLTETSHFRLGQMQFLAIPGELAPVRLRFGWPVFARSALPSHTYSRYPPYNCALFQEVGIGLPTNFDTAAGTELYFQNPHLHAVQTAYTLPGVVTTMMQCTDIVDCWLIGLCNDEVGYMFPISDWRLQCIGEEEACDRALAAGALNFTDSSMAGITCKYIVENQVESHQRYTAQFDEAIWTTVNRSCFYGQKPDGYPKDHCTYFARCSKGEQCVRVPAKVVRAVS